MKKLLLINWRDIKNPEAGGAEIYYHEIFKRLAERGYSISVLSHWWQGAERHEMIDGITVIRKGSKWLFNFEIIPYLLRHQDEYDLIIEDLNKIPFFTPLYLHRRPRLHLVMHFFGTAIFREALFPAALYVFCMEKLVPLFYREERFVAISHSTAREIERFPVAPERIGIVEPGIDIRYFKRTSDKASPPVLAYLGRLMKYKNVQFLIKALPRLLERFPELRLEIAGTGDYLPSLQTLAKKLQIAERVLFLGRISEEEKLNLLSRASLFVNPSSKEGWGINNIEANLCGTISLSSNVPGLRDSVIDGETGLLYTPDNLNDYCTKVIVVLTDTDRRTAMEKAAFKRARELDWNIIADRMAEYLV